MCSTPSWILSLGVLGLKPFIYRVNSNKVTMESFIKFSLIFFHFSPRVCEQIINDLLGFPGINGPPVSKLIDFDPPKLK